MRPLWFSFTVFLLSAFLLGVLSGFPCFFSVVFGFYAFLHGVFSSFPGFFRWFLVFSMVFFSFLGCCFPMFLFSGIACLFSVFSGIARSFRGLVCEAYW